MINKLKKEDGFTLLLAVLISGVILAVGIAIFNITFKEIRLSSAGRESQFAFYAADTGVECALFFERKTANANFAEGAPDDTFDITCNNETITVTREEDFPVAGTDTYTFEEFSLDPVTQRYCINITMVKERGPTVSTTTLTSRGTNTCDTTNNRRVERAIQVSF